MAERRRRGRLRRRLTLSHDGRPFLDRWGLCHDRLGGFYVHHIAGPDPGMDLHDHPWAFLSVILRGSYDEIVAPTREAAQAVGTERAWDRWTVHRMPLSIAHRIIGVAPGTWTLVLRGPTRRPWGFYPPDGWVEWTIYDYATRRPCRVEGGQPDNSPSLVEDGE